ncbi:ankyrin repeat-containing domain protein [Aspergillus crustosus]
MSGIPGAGKTVLAGSIIESALAAAAQTPEMGACFFFCDYKDPKSQELVNIYSSFASQLARQDNEAYMILEQYNSDLHPAHGLPKPPALPRLREILCDMCRRFDRCLIIVDCLDECGVDSPVRAALSEVGRVCSSASLALLSRDELHIREALELYEHVDIAAQSADVRRYLPTSLPHWMRYGRVTLMRYLRAYGCNINTSTVDLKTALDLAIQCQVTVANIDILFSMGARGSKSDHIPWVTNGTLRNYMTGLTVPLLLEAYSSDDYRGSMLDGLSRAIMLDDLSTCKQLKSHGCPVDMPLPEPNSPYPLIHGLVCNKPDIVVWLLENGGLVWGSAVGDSGLLENPISLAAGYPDLNHHLKRLLVHSHDIWPEWLLKLNSASPILKAIYASNNEGLKIILNFIAEHHNQERQDAIACIPNVSEILNTVWECIPLHEAAANGNVSTMKILLDHGADANRRDAAGKTALSYALWASNRESTKRLLNEGANPMSLENDFQSLLHFAAEVGDLELLKRAAASITATNIPSEWYGYISPIGRYKTRDCFHFLLEQGYNCAALDGLGVSAIHCLLGCEKLQTHKLQLNLLTIHELTVLPISMVNLPLIEETIAVLPKLARVLGKEAFFTMFPLDCGELDIVKYIVRAGAKLAYFNNKQSRYVNIFHYTAQYPAMYRWFLVERYTEQRKVCTSEPGNDDTVRKFEPWSCSRKAQVPLVGERKRREDESSLDYLVQLQTIKRSYYGEIVYY